MARSSSDNFQFRPLTPETWDAFEQLFGSNGACGGCWCMTWRLMKPEYESSKGEGNRKKMRHLIRRGEPVGVIAFDRDVPAGWCAVAPRLKYPRLEKSRAMRATDNRPVWTVSCFFIAKQYRRKGLSVKLLRAALDYAAHHGAVTIEAFPIDPGKNTLADVFAWTGILSTFLAAGFREEVRQTPTRPTVRYHMAPKV